jgi:hypothetical protein
VQSLRTVGIESIRIFVFSVLKKSPKEFDLFFLQRGLSAIYFSKKRAGEVEKTHNLLKLLL